jgi:hypothetical protein
MNLPNSLRPSKWPFFIGDGILVALAGLIGLLAPAPLSATALSVIFGCVALGAILAVLPALLDFGVAQRETEAALQRQLEAQGARLQQASEALAGIAGQLKAAHEATARAVHNAETLPGRLQEKIGEFTAELTARDDEEKAAMAKELEALRDTEGHRATAIAEKIIAATKEFTAAERQVLPALAAAAKLSRELEPALTAATARGEQALIQAATFVDQALTQAAAQFQETTTRGEQAQEQAGAQFQAATARGEHALIQAATLVEQALTQAATQFQTATTRGEKAQEQAATHFQAATARGEQAFGQAAVEIQAALAAVESRVRQTIVAAEHIDSRLADRAASLRQLEQEMDSAFQQKIDQLHAAVDAVETSAPRAVRRVRHEVTPEATEELLGAAPEASASAPVTAALPLMQLSAFPRMKREPLAPQEQPVPAAASPAAPLAVQPETLPMGDTTSAAEMPPKREPRRKPTTRNLGEAVLPGFAESEIVYDDAPSTTSAPARTSDGSTRLLVTAFIGIGNKVFIRGDGPGLSREKGVPMEFISIGKWSWESSDAIDPVTIQLFKNDDIPAQGDPLLLAPGHHVEVTPVFREPDPF